MMPIYITVKGSICLVRNSEHEKKSFLHKTGSSSPTSPSHEAAVFPIKGKALKTILLKSDDSAYKTVQQTWKIQEIKYDSRQRFIGK